MESLSAQVEHFHESCLEGRIESESGLTLRVITMEDAEPIHSLIQKNQDHFSKFDFKAPQFKTLLEVENAIESLVIHHEKARGASYGIWENNRLLGVVAVNLVDWHNKTADIGYWLSEQASGRGLAFQALNLLKRYLFEQLNLEKLTAATATTNVKSQSLLERVGFKPAKILETPLLVNGRNVPNSLYSLERA